MTILYVKSLAAWNMKVNMKKTYDDNLSEILGSLKHEGLYFLQVNISYISLRQIHVLN